MPRSPLAAFVASAAAAVAGPPLGSSPSMAVACARRRRTAASRGPVASASVPIARAPPSLALSTARGCTAALSARSPLTCAPATADVARAAARARRSSALGERAARPCVLSAGAARRSTGSSLSSAARAAALARRSSALSVWPAPPCAAASGDSTEPTLPTVSTRPGPRSSGAPTAAAAASCFRTSHRGWTLRSPAADRRNGSG
mmetsp:Transcript_19140/g.67586  ORF Transcript_19140/g.67586 Transcript_19140/m.67586 type:complete len:204 (+) Transcript_19140:1361-1972(+)